MKEIWAPEDWRCADPENVEDDGQREIVIAILNLTAEVGHLIEAVGRLQR